MSLLSELVVDAKWPLRGRQDFDEIHGSSGFMTYLPL